MESWYSVVIKSLSLVRSLVLVGILAVITPLLSIVIVVPSGFTLPTVVVVAIGVVSWAWIVPSSSTVVVVPSGFTPPRVVVEATGKV